MRMRFSPRTITLVIAVSLTACSTPPVDAGLEKFIAGIKAIDNHAHPMLPLAPGAKPDTEYDALPLDALPPMTLPERLHADHPDWIAAQRAVKERGIKSPAEALDLAGIDVMLSNRIALGPGLSAPRFLWVPFVDALMLPLDGRLESARTPDTRSLYALETKLLRWYMGDLGIAKLPATLDDYVKSVVTPTLERQRRAGAVAVKFEAAYLRALDFDDPDPGVARLVYSRYAAGGTPGRAEYKSLEDYLFRVIAREAGRLGMAVHIHCTEVAGSFYVARGSDPFLLESAFNDSTLRATKFVIIHGGWPLVTHTLPLFAKGNVYADISMAGMIAEPRQLANALRLWLNEYPDRVLFGTDAFDGGPNQSWEAGALLAANSARRALGLALTGMLRDGVITRERAEELARMVMRENAAALYGLGAGGVPSPGAPAGGAPTPRRDAPELSAP
jgi:predicted TIM-barrel fold metal-dependent hydrolase